MPRTAGRRAGRRPVVGRGPGDDPGSLGLEGGCQPAADDQPAERRATTAPADTATRPGRDRSQRERRDPRRQHVAEPDRRRQHDDRDGTRRMPPRSRKAASASGQVAGVASVTSSAAVSAAPRFTARGWPTPPRPVAPGPGARTWSRWRAAWTRAISVAVAGEVAVAQRGLGELEVAVGVVDQARRRRSAAPTPGVGARRRPPGRVACRSGELGRRARRRQSATGPGGGRPPRPPAAGAGRRRASRPRRPGVARRRRSA